MMGNKKTVFKYFTIAQYKQEEEYLSAMNEKGWRFTHATFPGFYHFEKCEPKKVSYALDYNQDGIKNKDEYTKMFSDCGWDYICDFVGYSYFRKDGYVGAKKEEIFSDDASRLDMMKRIFNGRIIPLVIIFALVIMPQLFLNTLGYSGGIFQEILSYIFIGLAFVYLVLFSVMSIQFYKYERQVTGDSLKTRTKYIGVMVILIAAFMGIGAFFVFSRLSFYDVKESKSGYVIEAKQLNTSEIKEYNLKKGDTIKFNISELEKGRVYLSICEKGEDPVFYCDAYNTGELEYEVIKDGKYEIEISGKSVTGTIEASIK